jgi:hypothetical protein
MISDTTQLETLEVMEGLSTRSSNIWRLPEPIEFGPTVGDFARKVKTRVNLKAGTFYTILAKFAPGKTLMCGCDGESSYQGEVDFTFSETMYDGNDSCNGNQITGGTIARIHYKVIYD